MEMSLSLNEHNEKGILLDLTARTTEDTNLGKNDDRLFMKLL